MRLPAIFAIGAVCFVTASCASHDEAEPARASEASISAPGLLPEPKGWQGSVVDLMVADAWSTCAAGSTVTATRDTYLDAVWQHMQNVACPPLNEDAWPAMRANKACNVDPSTSDDASVVLEFPPSPLAQTITDTNVEDPFTVNNPVSNRDTATLASSILQTPSINLCIAQKLRQIAPGTAGIESLLLSASDQRLLLEMTRQRAQLALVGFAQLAMAFTEPNPGTFGGANVAVPLAHALKLVIKWGRDVDNANVIKNLGNDMAAALQLHTIIGGDLATLYGRSSSAREARGGAPATPAAEIWGSGSWRQRSLASLYGGDPLAEAADGSSPWQNPTDAKSPAVGQASWSAIDWPSASEQPFASTDMNHPEVPRLLALARRFDLLDVRTLVVAQPAGCSVLDAGATADRLYRAVEAALRTADCTVPLQPAGCKVFTPSMIPDPALGFDDFALWKRHRIGPEHAALASKHLAGLLEPVCPNPGTRVFGSGLRFPVGIWGNSQVGSGWMHLSPDTVFAARSPQEIQPMFGRYTHFHMTERVLPTVLPYWQGIGSFVPAVANDAKRVLGSVASIAAVRDALFTSHGRLGQAGIPAHVAGYFSQWTTMMGAAEASTGAASVAIRPSIEQSGSGTQVHVDPTGPLWTVNLIAPLGALANQTYNLYAVVDDPIAGELLLHPHALAYGRASPSVFNAAVVGTMPTAGETTDLSQNVRRYAGRINLPVPSHATAPSYVTFFARPAAGGDVVLLAANVPIWGHLPEQGFYFAGAGALGTYATRLLATDATDPTLPRYDGFGLPTRWIPPSDPSLFGGEQADPVAHYLDRAEDAATAATQAVQQAFDTLIQKQLDETAAQAADAKAGQILQQEVDALCGPGNAKCDRSITMMPVLVEGDLWWPGWPTCPDPEFESLDAFNACNFAERQLEIALAPLPIAGAVVPHLGKPPWPAEKAPLFADYAGGALQGLFVEQWWRIQDLRAAVVATANAARGAMELADASAGILAAAGSTTQAACGLSVLEDASTVTCTKRCDSSTFSLSLAFGSLGGYCASPEIETCTNNGRMQAQANACASTYGAMPSADAAKIAATWSGLQSLAAGGAAVRDSAARIQQTSAEIARQIELADQAAARATLEASLSKQVLVTSSGLYRRYHDYDLWRAKAAMEDARRYAVTARRAIEARFVVDLSAMASPEPFVAAPATWADSVYDFDLSLPAAVGLTVGPESTSGIYPSKLTDYVGNLKRFVDGYAIDRPAAAAHSDPTLYELLGPETMAPIPGATENGLVFDSDRQSWMYLCAGEAGVGDTWVALPPSGKAMEVCAGGPPKRARLLFSLDPWGHVNQDPATGIMASQYNARWERLAVNLVGTAIKDCEVAADPLGCYTNASVPYDLAHAGPAWVMDYAEAWRLQELPLARIEAGKALAAEIWLDPVAQGWSESAVAAVGRWELSGRPLNGQYVLEIEVAPEIRLDRIERVQILAETAYWVRQD